MNDGSAEAVDTGIERRTLEIAYGADGRKEMFYLTRHSTLFPISNKVYFICTISQTGKHIPRALLHQSWNTGWNDS